MSMAKYRSFLFADAVVEGGAILLDRRESHHLIRVFRARVGDPVEVLDGAGTRYYGTILEADAKAARVEVDTVESEAKPNGDVVLLQSIPKGKAMDLILRTATEIGVSSIQPVFTEHGDVLMKGDRLASKLEKWRLTMIEACKQCGLAYLPKLKTPLELDTYLQSLPEAGQALHLVASLQSDAQRLTDCLNREATSVTLAVGPEGDFSIREYRAMAASGFLPVRLGANVLRAETAAAYFLSVVDQQYRSHSG